MKKMKIEMPKRNMQGTTSEYKYRCEKCYDRGIIPYLKDGEMVAEVCVCKHERYLQKLINQSGLTDDLRKKSFQNFQASDKQKKMLKLAADYCRNYHDIKEHSCNGLAFTGSVGTGKTHLLTAIANWLLKQKIPTCFVNSPDFINELRTSQFEDNKLKMASKMKIISEVEVAIFDDLGKEKVSEWVREQYYLIINNRYMNSKPTLFSANCDIDELSEKIGDATASRLYAMTKDRLVHIEDIDQRMSGR